MIRNRYKVTKKSALEMRLEDASAKAADLRESVASSVADAAHESTTQARAARKNAVRASKKARQGAAKKADRLSARADKATAKADKRAAKLAKRAPIALAGAAAAAATAVQEKTTPLVEQVQELPVVEKAHDTLMDEIMPRIADALAGIAASATAAKEAAVETAQPVVDTAATMSDRSTDAYAVLKGDKVAVDAGKRRTGTVFMVLGLVAAAAAAALTAYKQMQPQDDPWSTPLLDPYTPPTTGRDSSLDASTGEQAPAVATFAADREGTDADLTPAESAQGDSATVLMPVHNSYDGSQVSTAATTPVDDGAGQLLDPTAGAEGDEHGTHRN